MIWARRCQECGNIQKAKKPKLGEPAPSYTDSKCRRCKSMSLDYGHHMTKARFDELKGEPRWA